AETRKRELAVQKNDWYLEFIDQMTAAEILPGVVPFLDHLQAKGIKIALGSASKNAVRVLTRTGILHYFETIVDGNSVVKGKPDPEVFLKGASALAVAPANCIVFEDAERGIEAALRGGFYAIGIGIPPALDAAHLVIPNFENKTLESLVAQLS
ncbi:MAG: HAD-IA family hydrolase, partial [Bacteroidota bacterium]